jgi:hypothetical protein
MGRVPTPNIERDAILTRLLISRDEYRELRELAMRERIPTATYLGNVLRLHLEFEREETKDNVA